MIIKLRGQQYTNDKIIGNPIMTLGNGIVTEALSIDTFEFTVQSKGSIYDQVVPIGYRHISLSNGEIILFKASDEQDLRNFSYGELVQVVDANGVNYDFYLEGVQPQTAEAMRHICVSGIGLLDKDYHFGGIYTGESLESVALDIVGGLFELKIDAVIKNTPVFGHLPFDTKRNNLTQLLFAYGASLKKVDGVYTIGYVDLDVYTELSDDRVFLGESSIKDNPVSDVELTEHGYSQQDTDLTVTLFDNTDGSGEAVSQRVRFNNPCYNLLATGIVIEESSVNHAIVSGTGTLTGKEYTHTQRVVTSSILNSVMKNTHIVDNMTLVNFLNSKSVADNLLNFLSQPEKVVLEFDLQNETTTTAVEFEDQYDIPIQGIIQDLDIEYGYKRKRATASILTGYKPPQNTGQYSNYVELLNGETWAVPQDVANVKAVLISEGYAGLNGSDGGTGQIGELKHDINTQLGGEPGVGGVGGKGGKIFSIDLDVSNIAELQATTGQGSTLTDLIQTETTLTAGETIYSTENGTSSVAGFTNILTGEILARSGNSGIDGGKATHWVQNDDNSATGVLSYVIFDGVSYVSGDSGSGNNLSMFESVVRQSFANGGNGGGGAVGQDGSNGADAVVELRRKREDIYTGEAIGGSGGNGADAIINGEPQTVFGSGGNGGHGGGAGGAGGNARIQNLDEFSDVEVGAGGLGGKGSNGSKGGSGVVLIFY